MGFLPNYDRAPAEPLPRRQGIRRLFELLGRDFWAFFRAGFLALVGAVPYLLGMFLAVSSHVLLFALLTGIIGGALAGPQLCGLADTILRALRDEPGFWWHTYRRAWKRNAKECLLPGAILGTLLSMQLFFLLHAGMLELSGGTGAMLAAGALITTGLALYVWPQLALMDLSLGKLAKNAALLFVAQLPRSLGGLACLAGYGILMLWLFPLSTTLLPLTNLWLPAVPALFLIYPGLDSSFAIEETLARRAAGGEEGPESSPEGSEPSDEG